MGRGKKAVNLPSLKSPKDIVVNKRQFNTPFPAYTDIQQKLGFQTRLAKIEAEIPLPFL